MQHVLDNPAWNALVSGNQNLALGNETVKYFDHEVSPFIGLKENTPDNFQLLHDTIPGSAPVLFVATHNVPQPQNWEQLACIKGYQMVYEAESLEFAPKFELTTLSEAHVQQMLELTKLTNPGPFGPRTIEFGHYRGIFEGDRLASMAGHRLHPFEYTEISAVCTHPDFLGKGYARELLLYHINYIKKNNGVPFLHVRYDNHRAIKVYVSLGFKTRTEVYFHVFKKSE